jgi:hypothetical protein
LKAARIILSLTVALGAAHAVAQQGPGASDNELFVGYCIGVMDGSATVIRQLPPEFNDPAVRSAAQKNLQELQRDRQRYLGYLTATGVLLSGRPKALLGIQLAERRGGTDVEQCWTQGQSVASKCTSLNPFPTLDFSKQHTPDELEQFKAQSEAQMHRLDECVAANKPEPCQRLGRCGSSDGCLSDAG